MTSFIPFRDGIESEFLKEILKTINLTKTVPFATFPNFWQGFKEQV